MDDVKDATAVGSRPPALGAALMFSSAGMAVVGVVSARGSVAGWGANGSARMVLVGMFLLVGFAVTAVTCGVLALRADGRAPGLVNPAWVMALAGCLLLFFGAVPMDALRPSVWMFLMVGAAHRSLTPPVAPTHDRGVARA